MSSNPFSLADNVAYQQWRHHKLGNYPRQQDQLFVELSAEALTDRQRDTLLNVCRKTNFVIYRLADPAVASKAFVRQLGLALGLDRLDGNLCADEDNITSLQVMDAGRHAGYIPYTNRRLSWHTDGYYNTPEQQIQGILMHCVRPAQQGGENLLLDHEIAYIQLRDENPDYIRALMRDNAMTIPPNIENGVEIRGEQSGPVFYIEKATGNLHMRYSARTRNIEWFDDELTRQAVDCLNGLLTDNNPYVFAYSLSAGEGIICNNILHCRTGFSESEQADESRLLYRARYYDRVMETNLNNGYE